MFLSDPSPIAREVIGRYPGLQVIDPTVSELRAAIQQVTGEAHCQAIFDTVGTAETMQQALELLAPVGTYVDLAVHDTSLPLNARVLGSERTLTSSSNAYYRDEREAHALIRSGAVDVRSMITHRFRLDQYQEAFDLLLQEPKQAYKVVFVSES